MTANSTATALGLAPSFGFGDRLGLATPGHLAALRRCGHSIKGIFAQQSIREMSRTRRTADEVFACAARALVTEGFEDAWGADADHLKTTADVDVTADSGFIFYTIDPSDHVDQKADNYSLAHVEAQYQHQPWVEHYMGQSVAIDGGSPIDFDELTVKRAAVKYGAAIAHALDLAAYIRDAASQRGQDHEIEISVDETEQPTTPAEHYIIADQMLLAGVKLVSLAPRFVGDLEKALDYKGDLSTLAASLAQHAAIAAQLGPYKLSLHSGSDKLSMYRLFAEATKGRFHIKTAGTSYLEALRVVGRHDEDLLRRIVDFARNHYETDKATYHVSATVNQVPPPEQLPHLQQLEGIYLEHWADIPGCPPVRGFIQPGRQILHCTFGSVLTHDEFGPAITHLLQSHPETYRQVLDEHFGKHLEALVAGINNVCH